MPNEGLLNPPQRPGLGLLKLAMTTGLHMAQPIARLWGRLQSGLTPWRIRAGGFSCVPWPRTFVYWSEDWRSPCDRLEMLEEALRTKRAIVFRGGDFDQWDLAVKNGILGGTKISMVAEEHGGGKQQIHCKVWPTYSKVALGSALGLGVLSGLAFMDQAWQVGTVLAGGAFLIGLRMQQEISYGIETIQSILSVPERAKVPDQGVEGENKVLFPEPTHAID